MSGIFISYRREDCVAWAGRLFDRLVHHFGKKQVFMDIEGGIPKGAEFARVLDEALHQCDVLLALIGPKWLDVERSGHPRIGAQDDWVRAEIRTALERRTPVVPVLVGGGRLPTELDLPEDIRRMCARESVELVDGRWDDGVRELASAIATLVPFLNGVGALPSPATPLAVERIIDATRQRDDLLGAIDLLDSRLPEDELYDPAELFRLIQHHLSGDFGPSRPATEWRAYVFVAKSAGEIIGMLLAYDDLRADFCFIAYLAGKKPEHGKPERETATQPLLKSLLLARRDSGGGREGSRVIVELDHPAQARSLASRKKCIARLKLFEYAATAAGLDIRALDLDYVQPMLDPSKSPKHLLLAFASEKLGPKISRALAIDILTWMYTRLYSEDIFEDPQDRAQFHRHTDELLSLASHSIREEVRLLMARHFAVEIRI